MSSDRKAEFFKEIDKAEMWLIRMSASQLNSVQAQNTAGRILEELATLREQLKEKP